MTTSARAAVGGAMASLVFAASCSLVTSLDGYTGGSTSAADASVSTEASTPPPAPPPPPDDGGTPDADAGGRFCDSQSPAPKVCEDFDGVAIGPGWISSYDPGCTVSVPDAGARTPPGALLSTVTGASKQHALLRYALPQGVTKIHFAYDLRAETFGDYAEVGYIRIATATATQNHYLRLRAQPATLTLASEVAFPDGGVVQHDTPAPGGPTFVGWGRVQVDLDLAVREVAISVDGLPANKTTLEPVFTTGTTTVEVGIGYADASGMPWALRSDDVTVDWN